MFFLDLWTLWLLPLAGIPIAIHLLNLTKRRRVLWAATRFLLTGENRSARRAKLLRRLLLLCRVALLLCLVLAAARPFYRGPGGRWNWGAPKTLFLAFDRSAGVNRTGPDGKSCRERLLDAAVAAASREGGRVYLIDTFREKPTPVVTAGALRRSPLLTPTDAGADIPATLDIVADFLEAENAGSAEIQVFSDMAATSWLPASPLWKKVRDRLAKRDNVALTVVDRSPETDAPDLAVTATAATVADGGKTIDFSLRIDEPEPGFERLSALWLSLNGAEEIRDPARLAPERGPLFFRRREPLQSNARDFWGYWKVPPDANVSNNRGYFAAKRDEIVKAAVVAAASDARYAALTEYALAPRRNARTRVARWTPEQARIEPWDDLAAVILIGDDSAAIRQKAETFAANGGQVLIFPPTGAPANVLADVPANAPRLTSWERLRGVFRNADPGTPAPFGSVRCFRRVDRALPGEVFASLSDGAAFMTRQEYGAGAIYECAAALDGQWTNLAASPAFVILARRLAVDGGERRGAVSRFSCGAWRPPQTAGSAWDVLVANGDAADFSRAGVYRCRGRYVVLNVPPEENDYRKIGPETLKSLLRGVPLTFDRANAAAGGEIWPLFVLAALAFFFAEALIASALTAPPPTPARRNGEP